MTKIAVTIRDEHRSFIEAAVKSGRYVSENEVVAEAIAELMVREELRSARFGELRAEIRVGLDQLDRGEGGEWNPEAVRVMGRDLLASQGEGK